jgi:hypothetical protein
MTKKNKVRITKLSGVSTCMRFTLVSFGNDWCVVCLHTRLLCLHVWEVHTTIYCTCGTHTTNYHTYIHTTVRGTTHTCNYMC